MQKKKNVSRPYLQSPIQVMIPRNSCKSSKLFDIFFLSSTTRSLNVPSDVSFSSLRCSIVDAKRKKKKKKKFGPSTARFARLTKQTPWETSSSSEHRDSHRELQYAWPLFALFISSHCIPRFATLNSDESQSNLGQFEKSGRFFG